MHCYEVIPEGAVCKLYFDLEFQRAWNPGLDGEGMVARLIQVSILFLTWMSPVNGMVMCLFL